ncbi:hypothetical protein ACLMJK_006602 [Lecanora helva]
MSLCSGQVIRRNPWTCFSCASLARTPQVLVTGSKSRTATHQRKHSSSKTPNQPKDDTRAISAPTEAPTKETTDKRPSSRFGRRKSKDGVQDMTKKANNDTSLNLPSVPSTAHLHPSDVHMSSFFSIHRPISLTTPIPHESSNKAFSSIFDAKSSQRAKPADVIYTLSSAVDTLENAVTSQSHDSQRTSPSSEEMNLRQALAQITPSKSEQTTHHLDLPAKTLHFNLQELAKRFRPFVPPPAPVPLNPRTELLPKLPEEAQESSQGKAQPAPVRKSYTTTLTIHETSYPNGQRTYKTHTTPIIEDPASGLPENSIRYLPPIPQSQPFLGRMRQRQVQYLDRLGEREAWIAISVKRQRKLKMKKHKYKKLMKRTKNLRRRLDRT